MRSGDRLLLGTDLRKDREILDAAYNDLAGVTAEFNRNMLRVLNAELGADFIPERFAHHAFYNEASTGSRCISCPWECRPFTSDGIGNVTFADGEVDSHGAQLQV